MLQLFLIQIEITQISIVFFKTQETAQGNVQNRSWDYE